MHPGTNRAHEKALARQQDEDRVRRGEISPSALQQENLAFHGLKKGFIALKPKYRSKSAGNAR